MHDPDPSQIGHFHLQLAKYRSIAEKFKRMQEKNPLLYHQVEFWIESAQFCITELEIWQSLKDKPKYNDALHKAQETLERVHHLTTQLMEEAHPGYPKGNGNHRRKFR
jgi:hypothetical protein